MARQRRVKKTPLCRNRVEGFGPLSHVYDHMLTSCFLDVILVPLCAWLYLTAYCILIMRLKPGCLRYKPDSNDRISDNLRAKYSKSYKILSFIYYLFFFAQICMCILEMARLGSGNYGIGLLPFIPVTLLIAVFFHIAWQKDKSLKGLKVLNIGIFLALMITNGVKVAEELKEGLGARKNTKYPVSDQVTDVSVMVGIYFILAILEAII